MSWEKQYLNLLLEILENGENRADRTGTGTRSVFGRNLSIDLRNGFPLMTTKRMPFKSILSELLWFIEGSSDERRLAEILHGTRDADKKTIWSPNAEYTAGSKFKPSYSGDLGRIYGVQWRTWKSSTVIEYGDFLNHESGETTYFNAKVKTKTVDQLAEVIQKLKTNPTDRRIIMSAWNPGELDLMALPPCHMFVQFYLSNDRYLSAQMYQRSVDVFLGLPFNIASYALLISMISKVIGAKPGTLSMCLGDTHIYNDHFDAVHQQLERQNLIMNPPTLHIDSSVSAIDDFKMEHFSISSYEPLSTISARMSN